MAKTKALISFAVTAKLICVFVFAYADCWFSHEAAQILCKRIVEICIIVWMHDDAVYVMQTSRYS